MIKMFSVRKHIYSNQEAYVLTEWQLRVMNQQAQEKEYKIAHQTPCTIDPENCRYQGHKHKTKENQERI